MSIPESSTTSNIRSQHLLLYLNIINPPRRPLMSPQQHLTPQPQSQPSLQQHNLEKSHYTQSTTVTYATTTPSSPPPQPSTESITTTVAEVYPTLLTSAAPPSPYSQPPFPLSPHAASQYFYRPHPPIYHQRPYPPPPNYGQEPHAVVPSCAELTKATYCLEDEDYPEYEIKDAIQYHLDKLNSLYADVAELNTKLYVERLKTLEEETYLCPSETAYIRPLQAQNTDGKWRVIVNNIHVHYKTFTQTTRVEECLIAGEDCPKVPRCHESKCLQKSIYHRFLVYDPYDQYFPFAIESFKLPASCACLLGAYTFDH